MSSSSSVHSVRSHHVQPASVYAKIEKLATKLASATSKITLKRNAQGQAALWEEEMTTHRAGFTSPTQLGRDYVTQHSLSVPRNSGKRANAWGMGVGGAVVAGLGIALLATMVLPHVAGALILVGGAALVGVAAVDYWRAGAGKRHLARIKQETVAMQGQLQSLLHKLNTP